MSGQQSQGNKGGGGMQPRFGSPPGAQFGMNPMMPFGQGGYGGQSNRSFAPPQQPSPQTFMQQPPYGQSSAPGMYNTGNGMGSGYQQSSMGVPKPLGETVGGVPPSPYTQPGQAFNQPFQPSSPFASPNYGIPPPNAATPNWNDGLSLQEWQNLPASTRGFVPQPGSQDANRRDQEYANYVARYGQPQWVGMQGP